MKDFLKKNAIIFLFLVSAVSVVMISFYSGFSLTSTADMLVQNTQGKIISLAQALASDVGPEVLDQLAVPKDMEKPLYGGLKEKLVVFCEENGLEYAYFYRVVDGGEYVHAIIDNDQTEEAYTLYDDPMPTERALLLVLETGRAQCTSLKEYSDAFDGYMSAFAPIYDANGNIAYFAGVDVFDEQVLYTQSNLITLTVLLVLSILATLISGALGLYFYRNKAEQSLSANIAKSQFLSRMSHEIRTPMNAIIGLCRMAKESEDVSTIKGHLNNISTSSTHLLSLIDDILDLSKIEAGKVELHREPVDIRKEIDAIREIIAPTASAKELTLTFDLFPNLPQYLFCDSKSIRQILVNLLSNAVKFTPEGGDITVTVKMIAKDRDRCNLLWSVKDNGIGIDKKYADQLFEPFEQGDGSTTRKYGGTGLGLAITKQLVTMMDGNIEIRSELGKGSEFVFNTWLPLAERVEDIAKITGLEEEIASLDLSGSVILLVEDSEINRIIAQDAFEGMGAQVEFAENGQEGVQKFLESPDRFDLIFMDIQMPIMNGYEATKKIRSSGAATGLSVPIIAMTANVFKEDIDLAVKAGMNAHVGKPFEIEQIKKAIVSVMRGAR